MANQTYKKSVVRDPSGAECCVLRFNEDGSVTAIPFHADNTDYRKYLEWLAAGNTPEPAEEQQ